MGKRWQVWLIVLGGAALLSGCALHSATHAPGSAGCDLDKLGQRYALKEGETVLTPQEVQRRAVINSGLGQALQTDGDDSEGHPCLACGASQKRKRLSRILKAYAADEVRNQSAALALDAYYRLAEARLQIRLAEQGKSLADRMVTRAEEMKSKGLSLPQDLPTLRRQASESVSDVVRLELLRERLTEQLRQLADSELCTCKIGTIETFHVVDEEIEDCQAVAIGLKYRPDLNLLRAMLENLEASTLPLIRKVLGGSNPLLGDRVRRCIPLAECLPRLLPLLAQGELEKVRKELTAILCEREKQAVSEIRQAVSRVRATVRLAELAGNRESLARTRLAELKERNDKGLSTEAEMPLAQRDHLKGRSDVLHAVINWEVARVELRKAQGLLVREVLGECDQCPGNEPATPPAP
ncbi:MAG: hypothetical protein U0840_18780 [Gemmataceae bacterium]